jgi:hypothetical protein
LVDVHVHADVSKLNSRYFEVNKSGVYSSNEILDLLSFFRRTMECGSREEAFQSCLRFLREQNMPSPFGREALLKWALRELKEDNEEEFPSNPITQLLSGRAERDSEFSLESFLASVSERYLKATEYLFPLFHCFSNSILSLSRSERKHDPIVLFLRDCLVFWPSLLAAGSESSKSSIQLMAYGRWHRRLGAAPEIYEEDGKTSATYKMAQTLSRGLLVDAGMYGSLIQNLMESRYCSKDCAAMFLGSRNPFITGWLNSILSSEILRGRGNGELLSDIIWIVDTVESLLKPFYFGSDGRAHVANPISFVCSVLQLQAMYEFSREIREKNKTICPIDSIHKAHLHRESGDAWSVLRVVPRWSEADQFIQNWKLGPLFPMDQYSGLAL